MSTSSNSFILPPWGHDSSWDANALLHLLNATKPDVVDKILVETFRRRKEGLSKQKATDWQSTLSLGSLEEVRALFQSTAALIHRVVYHGYSTQEEIATNIFPADFHAALKKLLAKLLALHVQEWRETTQQALVGPPKLVDFDWRVDVETSSGHLSRMSVPVCLLSMTLQPPSTQVGIVPPTTSTKLEINQQELTTLLNGLEKIQQQLAGMK